MIDVVAAVIVRVGAGGVPRLLLTQRAPGQDYPLLWHCPGGKVEIGEEPLQALARKVREEIGVVAWPSGTPARLIATRSPPLAGAMILNPIAEVELTPPGAETRLIRWYPVVIGQRPALLECWGLGWFSTGGIASLRTAGELTVATEAALEELLDYVRRRP